MPLVVSFNVEDPEPVTVVGLKAAVTPAGNPETVKPTVPVKPESAPTVMVDVALPPAATVTEAGAAETEKPATFRVTDAVCVRLPLVAVSVKG